MAEKSAPTFGGFETLSDMLKPRKDGVPLNIDGTDDNVPYRDPDDITDDDKDDKDDKSDDNEPDDTDDKSDKDDKKDDIDIDKDDKDDDKSDDDTDDIAESEPEIAKFVAEQLATELNWSFGEDDKFESIGDVIDYMANIVEENSKPQYANDEVEKFDGFVRDGGNLRGFYDSVYSGKIDPEKVDLGSTENQRAVIREHLSNQGYKDERITRTIDRYETNETLEEESSDALELIKEFNEKKEQKLLNDQKKLAGDYQKQQQKFFSDVQDSIKNIKDIRGIPVNEKQKAELLDYIFRPDEEGMTKYQKDYISNVTNLIESAFLTKEGDKLFKKVEDKAKSDAYKNMKEKIAASKGKRNKTIDQQGGGASAGLSILGNYLRKPS